LNGTVVPNIPEASGGRHWHESKERHYCFAERTDTHDEKQQLDIGTKDSSLKKSQSENEEENELRERGGEPHAIENLLLSRKNVGTMSLNQTVTESGHKGRGLQEKREGQKGKEVTRAN